MKTAGPPPHCGVVLKDPHHHSWGSQDFQHLGVGGILAQGPHHVPTLTVQDLAIPRSVKQLEGLLEL